MSGHNKWSTIKHRKAAVDAKRGKKFTKLVKELTVAARLGGGDPAGNPRLRLAIQTARAASMPADNVDRAIKKGTGELAGGEIQELVYEGYGPGGVAFMIEVSTDNTNRSLSEIRNLLENAGGSFAKTGAVAFLFSRRGMLRFDRPRYTEEQLLEVALELGAEDVVTEDEQIVVYTRPEDFLGIKEAMDKAGLESAIAQVAFIPSTTVVCDAELAKKILTLEEKLEDNDDVANVFANYDISEDILSALS